MQLLISQPSVDFTIECEVSGRAYYEKRLRHGEWPGGRSGVTEGVGYDLGYTDMAKLQRDWAQVVNPDTFALMKECLGVTGEAARTLFPKTRAIDVSWDQASKVFLERDVPEYTNGVIAAIPGAEKLPPDCLGMLFSIGYNRGNGGWRSQNDRFIEMYKIRAAVMAGKPGLVPDLIRAMKRHWPSNDSSSPDRGLRARRDKEAAMFEKGLVKSAPPALAGTVKEAPPRTLPGPAPTVAEHGSAAGTVVTGVTTAYDASNAGLSPEMIALIVVGSIAAGVVVWLAVRSYRATMNPTLAKRVVEDHTAQQEG